MNQRAIKTTVFSIVLAFVSQGTLGHGGGTDSEGCHTERATGKKHCHSDFKPDDGSHRHKDYDRDSWSHWDDLDGDGRDTRDQLLEDRSLIKLVKKDDDGDVISGLWVGRLYGETIRQASKIHIDHVIPLAYASRSGGKEWSGRKKQLFANDPVNLLITSASANMSKSDQGPSKWMPENAKFRCLYLKRWIEVATKYQLNLLPRTLRYISKQKNCLEPQED